MTTSTRKRRQRSRASRTTSLQSCARILWHGKQSGESSPSCDAKRGLQGQQGKRGRRRHLQEAPSLGIQIHFHRFGGRRSSATDSSVSSVALASQLLFGAGAGDECLTCCARTDSRFPGQDLEIEHGVQHNFRGNQRKSNRYFCKSQNQIFIQQLFNRSLGENNFAGYTILNPPVFVHMQVEVHTRKYTTLV